MRQLSDCNTTQDLVSSNFLIESLDSRYVSSSIEWNAELEKQYKSDIITSHSTAPDYYGEGGEVRIEHWGKY